MPPFTLSFYISGNLRGSMWKNLLFVLLFLIRNGGTGDKFFCIDPRNGKSPIVYAHKEPVKGYKGTKIFHSPRLVHLMESREISCQYGGRQISQNPPQNKIQSHNREYSRRLPTVDSKIRSGVSQLNRILFISKEKQLFSLSYTKAIAMPPLFKYSPVSEYPPPHNCIPSPAVRRWSDRQKAGSGAWNPVPWAAGRWWRR